MTETGKTMDMEWLELKEKIQEAELVLVGLGEECQYDWNVLLQDSRYQAIERETKDNEKYVWIGPFFTEDDFTPGT